MDSFDEGMFDDKAISAQIRGQGAHKRQRPLKNELGNIHSKATWNKLDLFDIYNEFEKENHFEDPNFDDKAWLRRLENSSLKRILKEFLDGDNDETLFISGKYKGLTDAEWRSREID